MIPVPTHRLLSLPGKKFIKKVVCGSCNHGNRKLVDMSYNVLKEKKLKYVKNETTLEKKHSEYLEILLPIYRFIGTCTSTNIFYNFWWSIVQIV